METRKSASWLSSFPPSSWLDPVPGADGALTGSENGAGLVGWEARYHPIHTPIHRRTCLAPMADVYIHVLVLPTLFGLGN